MFQDLKNQRTIFEPDASRSWTGLKVNQPKKNHILKKTWKTADLVTFTEEILNGKLHFLCSGREEFFAFLAINGSVYTTTKMKTMYIASFVKMLTIIKCWTMSAWKIFSIKQDNLTGNMHKVLTKIFIYISHQQAIQRLIKFSKSVEDVSEIIKSNLTEVQSQDRACLIKIISCLRYLAR